MEKNIILFILKIHHIKIQINLLFLKIIIFFKIIETAQDSRFLSSVVVFTKIISLEKLNLYFSSDGQSEVFSLFEMKNL